MLLRREGVFSLMILNNDLRVITGNPTAQLNDVQREVITEIGLLYLLKNLVLIYI